MTTERPRDDRWVPLLRSCTYDMPWMTDEQLRILSGRLSHADTAPLAAAPVDRDGLDVDVLKLAMSRRLHGVITRDMAEEVVAEYAAIKEDQP